MSIQTTVAVTLFDTISYDNTQVSSMCNAKYPTYQVFCPSCKQYYHTLHYSNNTVVPFYLAKHQATHECNKSISYVLLPWYVHCYSDGND